MNETVADAGLPPPKARSRAVGAFAIKLLLLATFFIAYLSPILRASEESALTLFRIILPLVATVMLVRFLRQPITWKLITYVGVVLAYCVIQVIIMGLGTDPAVWSFIVNIVAAGLFVYFIAIYKQLLSVEGLFRHLYFWYWVLIAASTHQLLTGFEYPIVPYREEVARIFFGQENDTSLAIAGFLPMLVYRCRKDPIALVMIAAGVTIIWINGTRGIVLAVGAYPALLFATGFVSRFAKRARPLKPLLLILAVILIAVPTYVFKDTHIALVGDDEGSISELVLKPVSEVLRGEMMDGEVTSVNIRVTLMLVGLQRYVASFGLGMGPGTFPELGETFFPGLAASMHVFPLQMLVELGWLYVGLMIWIARSCGRKWGWNVFLPTFIYYNMITFAMSSGVITNYYFIACAAFAFLATPAAATAVRIGKTHG